MSPKRYSTYEAKARFSELMSKVREGETVVITYHGEPAAELRPVSQAAGLDARIERLRAAGRLTGAEPVPASAFGPIANRPGAVERFLRSRD